MSLVGKLIGFGLRQFIGDAVGNTAEGVFNSVIKHFADHSQSLPKALGRANDRAWQALSIALAGTGLLDQIKIFFASGDDKGFREEVRVFLQSTQFPFHDSSTEFRKKCLVELKNVKDAGLLSSEKLSPQDIALQTSAFQRYTDLNGMIDGAQHAVRQMADEVSSNCPNLAELLRQPVPGSPPLLTTAFNYFFKREVVTNQELLRGTIFDLNRQLLENQARGFNELRRAIDSSAQSRIGLAENYVEVEQITDLASGKVHDALALLNLRLPENVRFPPDDIVRWLMEDHIRRVRGARGPRHYFLLAYSNGRPCGSTLIHSFQQNRLAFIAYLASDKKVPWVAAALFRKFKELLETDKYLRGCQGFLLEVENPRLAPEGAEFSKRLALARNFRPIPQHADGVGLLHGPIPRFPLRDAVGLDNVLAVRTVNEPAAAELSFSERPASRVQPLVAVVDSHGRFLPHHGQFPVNAIPAITAPMPAQPERAAKIAAAKRGKPRPKHVIEAMNAARLAQPVSEESRRRMSEAQRRRGTYPPAAGRPFAANEDALLGTMLDRELAAKLGRSLATIAGRRIRLGIASFRRRTRGW